MKDQQKSKAQLVQELTELRQQLEALQKSETGPGQPPQKQPEKQIPPTPKRAVIDNEQRYRIISDLTSDYAYTFQVNPDGRLVGNWVTEAFTRITGFSQEELEAEEGWKKLIHPQDQDIAKKRRQLLLAGQPDVSEFRIITKDGKVRWLRDHSRPIWDNSQKQVIGIYGAAQDITDHRQTEEALRQAHQTLNLHVENSPLAVLEWDKDFRLQRWSRRAEEIFGWRAEEVLGKSTGSWTFIFPDDQKQVQAVTSGLLDGSLPRSVNQNRNYTKDGSVVYCEWYESALFDESGQLVSILSLVQDITERKQAETALQYRLEFEALITTISTNFINMPINRIDDGINQALQMIGQFVGVDFSYVFLPSDDMTRASNTHSWHAEGIRSHIDLLKDLSLGDFPGMLTKLKRFETVYIPSVAKMPPKLKVEQNFLQAQSVRSLIQVPMVYSGALKGVLGFATVREEKSWSEDIISLLKIVSEIFVNALQRKRIDQQLKYRAYQQAAIAREKELLLKEIHHRVKNNLQVVSSLLRLQSKQLRDEQPKEMFRDSQNRIKSMALIHEKLYKARDLSKIDFARYVSKLGVYLFQSYSINPATVQLEINVDSIFLDIDTAIPCGLIINELVSNSLKYAFPSPATRPGEQPAKIWIDLHLDSNHQFVLTVGDNGRGLPPTIDIYQSKSLGLQLVTRLVEQLNGRIEIDRSQGTTFTIIFVKPKA